MSSPSLKAEFEDDGCWLCFVKEIAIVAVSLRVTTLQRSNFPLKRKKEREGESLALLRI